jgi:hypothetical protein
MLIAEKNRLGSARSRCIAGIRPSRVCGPRSSWRRSAVGGGKPALKVFYERLIVAGKAKKVALIACARTLLTILNAIVRNNARWRSWETHLQCSC